MTSIPSSSHLLKRLRSLMQSTSIGKINAYIVPSGDAHQSEYIAECDSRRSFISKFTGSNGTAVITSDKAALWTDGRYYLQASEQLDPTCWTLMKDGLQDTPTQGAWLRDTLEAGSNVGVDPFLVSHDQWKLLSKELKTSNISLVAVPENLIDRIWEDKSILQEKENIRPEKPCNKIISLSLDITGKDWSDKVAELRKEMEKKKTGSIILTALDEIAWLLNLRGSDIDFNPVFFAYCIVTLTEVHLLIEKNQLGAEGSKVEQVSLSGVPSSSIIKDGGCQVKVYPYEKIIDFVKENLIPNETQLIWVSNRSSWAITSAIPKEKRFIKTSPVLLQKAVKNETEIQNIKNCHIRDSAALIEYLAWLDATIKVNPDGHELLWEISAAGYLEECRKAQKHFMGLSFPSISASGPNGAVIHYHPQEETRRPVGRKEMYLIDSGAQYLDGTTDVTRTVHFGKPNQKERECFTLVLKGHIQLALSIFPKFTKGSSLDAFARKNLWTYGLDYQHGTGHGVGMFLNVHEGPSSISHRTSPDDPGIKAGQILSNEPGYYENGSFGIRIESLVVTRDTELKYNFNSNGYLKFETLTLVPIQKKLIDFDLLTNEEIDWLNEYHSTCLKVVGDYLDETGKQDVKKWLIKETEQVT